MISAVVYDAGDAVEYRIRSAADLAEARDAPGTTWVRVADPTDDELERVTEAFTLHPLAIEDIQNDVRPKTEEFPAHTFILVKTASLRRGETTFDEEVLTRPVGLFVGSEWLVSVTDEEGPVGAVSRAWRAVVDRDGRTLQYGPDFAAYRIVDRVVDEYFMLLDDVGDTIEGIENNILDGPDGDVLEALNAVRRDLLSFRKVVWPTREALSILSRGDAVYVREQTERYYRDVYDHLVEVVDLTETYRDLARGARDIYLNALSQSTNEVMKRLTVVATIFIPLTFVAGVYGMNFSDSPYNMPELQWTFGYPAVMLGMAVVSVVLLVYFRREGWM
jgi:magnesium transporter